MTEDEKLEALIQDLGSVIHRHAAWLDGATFLRACRLATSAYFGDADETREVLETIRQELARDG